MSADNKLAASNYRQRLARREQSACKGVWRLLDQVKDPEIPVLSLFDLGVLHDISEQDGVLTITITPTYSGCPALHAMQQDIEQRLEQAGVKKYFVNTVLSPAWSSDSLSPQAHAALLEYGIAPPQGCGSDEQPVSCPHCQSGDTRKISEFGSTACKALYQCNQCAEPFDYFKCL